jgi:hypothetical protein
MTIHLGLAATQQTFHVGRYKRGFYNSSQVYGRVGLGLTGLTIHHSFAWKLHMLSTLFPKQPCLLPVFTSGVKIAGEYRD